MKALGSRQEYTKSNHWYNNKNTYIIEQYNEQELKIILKRIQKLICKKYIHFTTIFTQ